MSSGRDMVRAAYCHPHVKYVKSVRLEKLVMPISHNFQSKGRLYVQQRQREESECQPSSAVEPQN